MSRHRAAPRRRATPPWPFWRVLAFAVVVTLGAALIGSGVVLYRANEQLTQWVPPERGVIRER